MIGDIEVKFVRQPTVDSCVPACLSMVTGVPVGYIIDRFEPKGTDNLRECTILTEMGILPIRCSPYAGSYYFPYQGVYMVTAPTLRSLTGSAHRLVVESTNEKFKVFDPQKGNKGKKLYTTRMFNNSEVSYSEVTFLQPMPDHENTNRRLMLYDARS
jgi:hypothetical protein